MTQKIHFVTGKGGVGKSLYALSLATQLSKSSGERVLLVELGDKSFYKEFLGLGQVGFQPRALSPKLDLAIWSGQDCLREYAGHLLKIESLARLFFENKVMRTFIDVAPALTEIAILGKLTSGIRHHGPPLDYDSIVVDAFSTGHFRSLLEAPQGLAEVISMGPMGEQSRGILSVLRSPTHTRYHVVTLPESLPAKEAAELSRYLQENWSSQPSIVVNKVLPEWDASSFTGEFARSFAFKKQNQKEAEEYLQSFEFRTLPFIPELEAEKLVSTMSQEISWL